MRTPNDDVCKILHETAYCSYHWLHCSLCMFTHGMFQNCSQRQHSTWHDSALRSNPSTPYYDHKRRYSNVQTFKQRQHIEKCPSNLRSLHLIKQIAACKAQITTINAYSALQHALDKPAASDATSSKTNTRTTRTSNDHCYKIEISNFSHSRLTIFTTSKQYASKMTTHTSTSLQYLMVLS